MARKERFFETIGNVRFENCGATNYVGGIRHKDIYSAYRKPSIYKIRAWEFWKDWAYENGFKIGVGSHNAQFFSIAGYNLEMSKAIIITKNYYKVYDVV